MSRAKPGRNDPCPCGSGKKYKACHAAEDRARPAAPPAPANPLAEDLQAAMALLGEEDLSRVSESLRHLGALLTAWGPAPGLRFDAQAFDTHVSGEFARLAEAMERDLAQARNELRVSTVRELGTRTFLERLRAALLGRAATAGLTSEDRRALCLGALLASTPKSGRFNPEDRPVLDVVFDVQFREWSGRQRQEWSSKLEALTGGPDLTDEAREALRKASEGDVDALVRYVESDPQLASRISQEAKERSARVEAAMRQPATPSVFTPDEQVWLTCALWEPMRALKSPGAGGPDRNAAVSSFLDATRAALKADPEFLAIVVERMRAKGQNAALDEATRAFFSDAAVAFEAEPVRMVLASILTARNEPQPRSPEEQVMLADLEALATWTPESLEPYQKLLEEMGQPASTERIRRAQEWLRERAVVM